MKKHILSKYGLLICGLLFSYTITAQIKCLIPNEASVALDYFCTWNVQGYYVSYSNTDDMRKAMNEGNMFGSGNYQNWVGAFYNNIRQDLIFVMDDSWDLGANNNGGCNYSSYTNTELGQARLSISRFPNYQFGSDEKNLKALVDKVKSYNWKGLGGWVCAQSPNSQSAFNEEHFTTRLIESENAGFCYWKVDWGKSSRSESFHRAQSTLARKIAPNVIIENALMTENNQHWSSLQHSDVYRSYDVDNCIAQAQTIQRVAKMLTYNVTIDSNGNKPAGIINCEDEPYIAAGLGCTIGVMRFPWPDKLPNGKINAAFPESGRYYNRRIDEVIRGVRWHRIALPFSVNNDVTTGSNYEKDYWQKQTSTENSTSKVTSQATPMFISRGMELPIVTSSYSDQQPRVLASKYPNGAYAVVTVGRQLNRTHMFNEVPVSINVSDLAHPIGIFGKYKSLTINTSKSITPSKVKVYAQDLKSDEAPIDITSQITVNSGNLVIPGTVISEIGLAKAAGGDLSDPGMVLLVVGEGASDGNIKLATYAPSSYKNDQYYLYNVGTGKYIKTGGIDKGEFDSPGLVQEEDATPQVITKNEDGTYLIAGPSFPQGWGIQGRNTIYESNNGSLSTNSWGTTLTPGWSFVSTGEPDTYYIQYTWGDYTAGSVFVTSPANKTFGLYYGDYAFSTDSWSAEQKNDVANPWIYGDFAENLSKYGNNAKWKVIPIGNGSISTGISDPFFVNESNLSLYPNPVSRGRIDINFGIEQYNSLSIFNSSGMLVYSKQLNVENSVSLDVSDVLKTGVYLVLARSNTRYATSKLVVE